MKVIGITGSVATGKSTVSGMFASLLGADVISADEIVARLLTPGEKTWKKVTEIFGKGILKDDSSIDRKELGNLVFSDTSLKEKLEDIVHPEVKRIIGEQLKCFRDCGKGLVIIEVPLLFESKMESMVDVIVVVVRDEHLQLETLHKGKNLSRKEAMRRIKAQMPLKEKVQRAHFVVDNNSTLYDTRRQVKKICACLNVSGC